MTELIVSSASDCEIGMMAEKKKMLNNNRKLAIKDMTFLFQIVFFNHSVDRLEAVKSIQLSCCRLNALPYRFLEGWTLADVAFEATGKDTAELFTDAGIAVLATMVLDVASVERGVVREVKIEADSLEMLLFKFLEEIIYFKDAENLFFSSLKISISTDTKYSLMGQLEGEKIDPKKHELLVDVKAVTFHRFEVKFAQKQWLARVVLDV